MQIFREADVRMDMIAGWTVAIIGYGNQGHAHAQNLRDSGAKVVVGARSDGPSAAAAADAGFEVMTISAAAAAGDVVMLSLPDEVIPAIYRSHIHDHLRPGAALGFAHGLAVHFGLIQPRDDVDIFLVAPKGAGRWVRHEFRQGRGLAALFAVARDASGSARDIAMAYAAGLGCARAGLLETSFKDECETDLFGEQAVLCGGIPDLILAGYETLVAAGYEPEMAYFECVHEAKLIVDLIFEGGFDYMRSAISNTAEFGGYEAGEQLIDTQVRGHMQRILSDIQSGDFARRLVADHEAGGTRLQSLRTARRKHGAESDGESVRAMMPWLIDKT